MKHPLIAFFYLAGLSMVGAAPPEPSLDVNLDGFFEVSWPQATDGKHYALKMTEDLALPIEQWADSPDLPSLLNGVESVTTSFEAMGTATVRQFFRLVEEAPLSSVFPRLPGAYQVEIPETPDPTNGAARKRLIYVFLPDNYDPPARDGQGRWPCEGAHPLAIILHGSGQTAASFQSRHPDLITKCNQEGMILIVPQGTANPLTGNHGWNSAEQPSQRNDLRFLVLLRALASAALFVDQDRVHVGGFSNGGLMAMVASHSLPRLFASSAAVGASVRSENLSMGIVSSVGRPLAPHPVFLMNAKNDRKRPFLGGVSADGLTDQASFASGQALLSGWHCPNSTSVSSTFNLASGGLGGTVESWCQPPHLYQCPEGFEVRTIALEGGGHQWPDADDLVGVDANVEVIDFFSRHSVQPVADYGQFSPVAAAAPGSRVPLPGSGIDVAMNIPNPPGGLRGLVVFLHGPGTNHDTFVDVTEMTAMASDVFAAGLGWVAYSADHASGQWDLVKGPASNNDLLNLLRIRQELISLNQIGSATPIIPIGFDQGAHFALLASHLLHSMGLPVGGCGMLCPDFSAPLPAAAQSAKENTRVPIWMFAQENDQVADATLIWNFHETLRYRDLVMRQYGMMTLGRAKCPQAERFDRIQPAVDGVAILEHLQDEGLLDAEGHRTFCKRDLGSTLAGLAPPSHLGYTLEQQAEIFFQIQVIFAAHHPEAVGSPLLGYFDIMLTDGEPDPWIDLEIPPETPIDIPDFSLGD